MKTQEIVGDLQEFDVSKVEIDYANIRILNIQRKLENIVAKPEQLKKKDAQAQATSFINADKKELTKKSRAVEYDFQDQENSPAKFINIAISLNLNLNRNYVIPSNEGTSSGSIISLIRELLQIFSIIGNNLDHIGESTNKPE